MTKSEAIKEIRFNMSTIGLSNEAAKRVVEARDMAIQAIEKQIPKKVVNKHKSVNQEEQVFDGEDTIFANCPCCTCLNCSLWNYSNCGECGQAIDWSDTD